MVIFKNSRKYQGYVTKRFWTFVPNDCQNEESFYLDKKWMYDKDRKFASICKSKCINTNAHTKMDTTESTPWTRTTTLDRIDDGSGFDDDTEQLETEE